MAISFNTSAGADSTTASVPVTIPAGVLAGDVVLIVANAFAVASGATISVTSTGTTPTLGDQNQTVSFGGNFGNGWWGWFKASASDHGKVITATISTGTAFWSIAIAAYTGASGAAPIDVHGATTATGAGASVTYPSLTTVAGGDWGIQLCAADPNTTFTEPSGTSRVKHVAGSGVVASIVDTNAAVAAGATIGGGTGSDGGGNCWYNAFTVGLTDAAAFKVTATQSGTTNPGTTLQVKVLTSAVEAGGASATAGFTGTTKTVSLTPAATNSLPVFSWVDVNAADAVSAATNNTLWNANPDSTSGYSAAEGFYSAAVTSGTPVTAGVSTTGSSNAIAAYEIKPSGGSTPSVDASSPAAVNSLTTSAVTAGFIPPAGAVLVALVAANGLGGGGSTTITMTDTSGLGLVWTNRGSVSPGGGCWIFTATVPAAAGGTGVKGIPLVQRGGRTWRRRFQRSQPWRGAYQSVITTVDSAESVTGAGSVAAPIVAQGVIAAAAGAGSVAAPDVAQQAAGNPAGAGSVAAPDVVQGSVATAQGLGSVAAPDVTQQAGATAQGAGSVAAPDVIQEAGATAQGAGSVSASAVQEAGASAAGAGSVSASAVQEAGATSQGAGSVIAPVTSLSAIASAQGSGSVAALSGQSATATAQGAGSVTASLTQQGAGGAAGAGSVSAPDVSQGAVATASGAGSVAAPDVVQEAGGSPAGAGSVSAPDVIQEAGAAAQGAGSVSASAVQEAGATAQGAGSVAAPDVVQKAGATAQGAGAVSASAVQEAAGSPVGAGSVAAPDVVQEAGAAAQGAGSVTALSGQEAGATAQGAGSVVANFGGSSSGAGAAAGAGSVAAPAVVQEAGAAAQGAGLVAAPDVAQAAGAVATGAGSVTAPAVQQAGATVQGAGSVAAAAGTGPVSGASGAGSVSAPDSGLAAGGLAQGAGQVAAAAAVIQEAEAIVAGAGSVDAIAALQGSAQAQGAGNVVVAAPEFTGSPAAFFAFFP